MARRDEPLVADVFATVLDAARANAGWAYGRLFTEYAPRVLAFVRARGAAEPDEVTNDVFLSCFRSLSKFAGDEPAFRAWLFTIARNRVVDEHRKQARRIVTVATDMAEYVEAVGGDVESEAMANVTSRWVRDVLDQLAPDQRDVLLLRIVADCSIDQIADIVGKRPGAVKALQRRGLLSAKRILERQGVPQRLPVDV